MANIKKVVIKKEDLPAFNGTDNKYYVRYRVISSDRNRSSHWSPYHSVSKQESPETTCSVSVVSDVVNMVWKQPTGYNIKQFDIYFKLGSQEWAYVSSSSSTQFSTLIDSSVSSIQVAIQLPTYPHQYFVDAAIFTSEVISV